MKHLLILALLFSNHLVAQRFNAGAVLGVNFSQIDGDYQFGFHKKGITAGAKAVAYLSPLLELNIDLMYSQRGARPSKNKPDIVNLDLNFVETVFLLNIKVPKTEEAPVSTKRRKKRKLDVFIPLQIHTGVSFGRLTHSEVVKSQRPPFLQFVEQEVSFEEIRTSFNKNDISFVAGFSYFFDRHIGSSFRFYVPTNKLYDSASFPDRVSRSMRSFFLTAQLVYLL
ncbi:MAG: PorT family protein [Saprospiraceae bacterium]|nr:PorT family protein [Saprospiraceae bacterium]